MSSSSLIGRKLGKYEITELLGRGGMATVYKGYQEEIDRYVAVKVLPPHPGQDPQFIERFRLEARTVARLQHPHILPLYDYGVEDDILYLVMAFVEGGSLSDRIDQGPMPLPQVEQVVRQIGSALDYAHRQGVIHRDIKPDNILLDSEGHALLADFGIVKIVEGETNLTGTGGLVGTPAYIAPEQGRGEMVTDSADLYSLGVVTYEMITGKQPYTADTAMQVVIKHMNEPVPSISQAVEGMPAGLELVMQRVLAKSAENRYKSATEFAEDFVHAIHTDESFAGLQAEFHAPAANATIVLDSEKSAAAPPPTIIMQGGQNPMLLLGGFALIAVAMVVVVVLLLNNRDSGAAPVLTTAPTVQPATARPTAVPIATFGSLSFGMTSVLGDTVTLRVENLAPPGVGRVYTAWLKNTSDDSLLSLGDIRIDALGNGALAYTDPDGRALPTLYNAILITAEENPGDMPSDTVVYSGSVPTATVTALSEILVTSTGGLTVSDAPNSTYGGGLVMPGTKGGLLYSALLEADVGFQHSGLAAEATSVGGMHTHAEHTINILLGTQDDYDGNGRGDNPGRGFGVPHFLDAIDEQLEAVMSGERTADSQSLEINAELMRVCLVNVRTWIDQIVNLEHELLDSEDIEAVAPQAAEARQVAGMILNGNDLNGNGQVEPFEGECGLQQISTYSVLLGSINIVEGPLESSFEQ